MTSRKTQSPSELIKNIGKSKSNWEEVMGSRQNTAAARSFYDKAIHDGLNCIYACEANDALKLSVVKALPDYFLFRIMSGTTIETNHEDEILKMLLTDELLECCLEHSEGARGIAWFCTQRAQGFERFNLTDYEELLSKFLMKWLGLKTPDPFKNKMADIAGLVYGGHRDSLSILGFGDNPSLPNDLWLLNQAVFKPQVKNTIGKNPHELPTDVSM